MKIRTLCNTRYLLSSCLFHLSSSFDCFLIVSALTLLHSVNFNWIWNYFETKVIFSRNFRFDLRLVSCSWIAGSDSESAENRRLSLKLRRRKIRSQFLPPFWESIIYLSFKMPCVSGSWSTSAYVLCLSNYSEVSIKRLAPLNVLFKIFTEGFY